MEHDWGPRSVIVSDAADVRTVITDAWGEPGALIPTDPTHDALLRRHVCISTLEEIGDERFLALTADDVPPCHERGGTFRWSGSG